LWVSSIVALASFVGGVLLISPTMLVVAATGSLTCIALWLAQRRLPGKAGDAKFTREVESAMSDAGAGRTPTDTNELVEEMLRQGRYSLLLRPQLRGNLSDEQLRQAQAQLDQETAWIPRGHLCLGIAGREAELDDEEELPDNAGTVVEVDDFRLDRHAVSNRAYRQFVSAGGYTQASLWDPQVWPAVVDFVDSTGNPGPRFWINGTYPPGKAEHPVVGISWYEAAAYARWIGKRLPTDPEWEKAASWPVELSDATLFQRRYPWGDTMERERANLWGSGSGETAPVDSFAGGVSMAGVHQLIGNVWEWTTGVYGHGPSRRKGMQLNNTLKTIRGGAFDTYFDNQATAQFQSGENPVSRRHNIGFRCAVSACDLVGAGRRLPVVREEEADERQCSHHAPRDGAHHAERDAYTTTATPQEVCS
jgi:iron(II)-dependent oxidoreductase